MFKKLLFNKFIILLVVVFLAALQQEKASANSSRWVDYEQGKVRLIAANLGQDNIVPYLGLQFSILPGWKIFWRSPGEAGYPLEINNIKSKNVSLNEIQWPYPERFEFGGIYTYGYNKDVVLPLKLDLDDKNLDVSISFKLEFHTCKDVCIPKQVNLSIPNLTFNQHKNSDIESLLKEYLGKVNL